MKNMINIETKPTIKVDTKNIFGVTCNFDVFSFL